MNERYFGESRAYKGWRIQDVYEARPSGMRRAFWQAAKNGAVMLGFTLAELKQSIRDEEYQYEE